MMIDACKDYLMLVTMIPVSARIRTMAVATTWLCTGKSLP
jgi:hypothetical protein